jgi:hypothetical protein
MHRSELSVIDKEVHCSAMHCKEKRERIMFFAEEIREKRGPFDTVAECQRAINARVDGLASIESIVDYANRLKNRAGHSIPDFDCIDKAEYYIEGMAMTISAGGAVNLT